MAAKLLLLAAAALLLAPGVPPPGEQATFDPTSREIAVTEPKNCRDRIRQVREKRGLPKLDSETADPVMIYAVDRREDGCSVMVVAGNPEDIRPLPENKEGPLFRRIPRD